MTGDEIRSRRLKLGMTQEQFAAALDVTATAVAYWERGERQPAMPKVLDMAISWLESQQPKSDRHKTTMRQLDDSIQDSRAALTKKK